MKEISTTQFIQDVNSGMTKGQLIERYGVSSDNIKKIARKLNLTIKRATKPRFILIDDVVESTQTSLNNN